MATLLKVDGSETEITFTTGLGKLAQWQRLVGGYVEHIRLRDKRIMLCDEEARFKSKPLNAKASDLWGSSVLGDVILCTYKEFQSK